MSQNKSDATTTEFDRTLFRLSRAPMLAVALKENSRKQEEAIQAIEDSAYIVRRGRREVQDPKRLVLAIELRRKYLAEFITFFDRTRDGELAAAYINDLLGGLLRLIEAEAPQLRQRFSQLLADLQKKYEAPKENSPAEPGRSIQNR